MPKLSKVVWSSVGKKFFMAITGLAMIIFLIEHLSGNLLLFNPNPEPFNKYSDFLISFGSILIVAELILVVFLLYHIIVGVSIAIGKMKARPEAYTKTASAGGSSKKTLSSTTMIYTGILIFVFLIIHLKTFKYGPGIAEGYVIHGANGKEMRDLYRLAMEVFHKPGYVIWYVFSMVFLGFHLRHGFWSAFQSMGVNHPKYTPIIYTIGILVAIVLAVGFVAIPIWIYFTGA